MIARLNAALEPDGFAVTIVNGRSQLITRQASGVVVSAFAEKTRLLDFDTVQRDIARALASAADDPEDAATAASSLIEAVCRSILVELGLPLPAKKDIDGLVRAVQEWRKLPDVKRRELRAAAVEHLLGLHAQATVTGV